MPLKKSLAEKKDSQLVYLNSLVEELKKEDPGMNYLAEIVFSYIPCFLLNLIKILNIMNRKEIIQIIAISS